MDNDLALSRLPIPNLKAINSRDLMFSSIISMAELEEEQVEFGRLERVQSANTRLRYYVLKAFHLGVRDDVLYFSHLIYVM